MENCEVTTANKTLAKGKDAIEISNSNKVIELLSKDNELLTYVVKHHDSIETMENNIVVLICKQFYTNKRSFTALRKKLLNSILNCRLNWQYIWQQCLLLTPFANKTIKM